MRETLKSTAFSFMGAFFALCLIMAHGNFNPGGTWQGTNSPFLIDGTTVSLQSGYSFEVSGATTFSGGVTIPAGQKLITPEVKGVDGSTLTIAAGDTAGDDVQIVEGAGDGGHLRLDVRGGGGLLLNDPNGTNAAWISQTGLSGPSGTSALNLALGATIPAGQKLVTPEVEAEGTSGRLDLDGPSSGTVRFSTDGTAIGAVTAAGLYVDNIFGGGGAADPVNLSAGAVIPAGKNLTTPVVQSPTSSPLYVQTQNDQQLYIQAYGDGTGDVADINFRAGNANAWYISQSGYLVSTLASRAISVDQLSDRSGSGPPVAINGLQVGDADGDKLYFGSTSNYLEWDAGTNGLLFNGDAAASLDLDGGILAGYQYIGTEIADPGAAAAGTFRLYRESTGDTVDVQTETDTTTIHTEVP